MCFKMHKCISLLFILSYIRKTQQTRQKRLKQRYIEISFQGRSPKG